MIVNPSELGLPKAVVLSVVGFGAVSYFVLGPLVGHRVAEREYYPACMAGEQAKINAIDSKPLSVDLPPMPEQFVIDEMVGLWERSGIDALTGGMTRRLADEVINAKRQAAEFAEKQRRDALKAAMPEPNDFCSCLVGEAMAETQTAWAIYAGSIRFIERPDVTSFQGVMSRVQEKGICGA